MWLASHGLAIPGLCRTLGIKLSVSYVFFVPYVWITLLPDLFEENLARVSE